MGGGKNKQNNQHQKIIVICKRLSKYIIHIVLYSAAHSGPNVVHGDFRNVLRAFSVGLS